ncbi:hypothetical protein CDL12_25375 [Handroanthus impetiginosus]|uniref:Uncharacterized protein n=1 Tax=Handroanthus impetiginosus TaxID=429701 RepID=A0A2G9G9Z8_9LAMI|nr:hypothetical protein CDL12_25375 [Handroanthus impetiginosus]
MAAAQHLEANVQETVQKWKEIRTMEVIAMKYLSFYFICQGLVLVGVIGGSSSSSLKCHQFWLVFTLSLSLAMAYLIQLLENAWRYKETLELLYKDVTSCKMQRMWGVVFMVLSLIIFVIFTAATLVAIRRILC